MNKVTLFGFLGRDFEISKTNSGKLVAKNSLAITKRWINSNGNKEEHTDWIPITLFDKSAENANAFFKKGDRFLCEGEINTYEYIIEETNEKRYGFSVIVRNFHFTRSKDESTNASKDIQTDLKENELPNNEELNQASMQTLETLQPF
ncbi:single-stranded DNA-binding protein [Campylobacter avium]|uniref:single-stranded DNA-binding protein n=1 Tax=Campylobacter avium TaxID=522485 RepID=UPI0023569061|nr:single-stranded DNA-binding protein [Campylobacter avium]